MRSVRQRHRESTILEIHAWERRRYWADGLMADEEVWQRDRLLSRVPRSVPSTMRTADFCKRHRTRIYTDLACQFCGERPGRFIDLESQRSLPLGVVLAQLNDV